MDTVLALVLRFVTTSPGATNPQIRAHLRQRGYANYTKTGLNQLLYRLVPEHLRWEELADGRRGWWTVAAGKELTHDEDGVLVLTTSGEWTKG